MTINKLIACWLASFDKLQRASDVVHAQKRDRVISVPATAPNEKAISAMVLKLPAFVNVVSLRVVIVDVFELLVVIGVCW